MWLLLLLLVNASCCYWLLDICTALLLAQLIISSSTSIAASLTITQANNTGIIIVYTCAHISSPPTAKKKKKKRGLHHNWTHKTRRVADLYVFFAHPLIDIFAQFLELHVYLHNCCEHSPWKYVNDNMTDKWWRSRTGPVRWESVKFACLTRKRTTALSPSANSGTHSLITHVSYNAVRYSVLLSQQFTFIDCLSSAVCISIFVSLVQTRFPEYLFSTSHNCPPLNRRKYFIVIIGQSSPPAPLIASLKHSIPSSVFYRASPPPSPPPLQRVLFHFFLPKETHTERVGGLSDARKSQ